MASGPGVLCSAQASGGSPCHPGFLSRLLWRKHPFYSVCMPQRMQMGLDLSVLPSLYRLEDLTDTVY